MASLKSKIELDNVNDLELVKHLETVLEDYRLEHIALEGRIIVSNKQLVHKINMLSGNGVKIKTKSRKVSRNEIWSAILIISVLIVLRFLFSLGDDIWLFVLLLAVLYEKIISPVRNEEYKSMVREQDRVIGLMRDLVDETGEEK